VICDLNTQIHTHIHTVHAHVHPYTPIKHVYSNPAKLHTHIHSHIFTYPHNSAHTHPHNSHTHSHILAHSSSHKVFDQMPPLSENTPQPQLPLGLKTGNHKYTCLCFGCQPHLGNERREGGEVIKLV